MKHRRASAVSARRPAQPWGKIAAQADSHYPQSTRKSASRAQLRLTTTRTSTRPSKVSPRAMQKAMNQTSNNHYQQSYFTMTFTAKHTTLAALILGLLATAMPFVTDAASQCDRDVYPAPWTLSQWRACGLSRADADKTALAALEERLSGITLLPAALRAQVTFEISLNKQNVANMRARIDDADTIEVIKPLVNDIARNYRVRGLVVPKLNVLITAESARFTVDKLTTTHDALKARVDKAAAAGKNVTTMRTYLELMLGSIQSAKASAESASAKVQGLTPDMGDKAKANSNRQAIFEGRAYIVANKASFAAANDYAAKIREWLKDNNVVIVDGNITARSEEQTSELQSHVNL